MHRKILLELLGRVTLGPRFFLWVTRGSLVSQLLVFGIIGPTDGHHSLWGLSVWALADATADVKVPLLFIECLASVQQDSSLTIIH